MTKEEARPGVQVIAHRGASGELPENTLPAYELAIERGADMIEIDLHRTGDGHIVITHDESLEGLGGRGEIADASLAEVRALDAGNGEQVPTLAEVLDRFGERIAFNLEIKRGTRGTYAGLEEETLRALRGRRLAAPPLFSSFFDPVLERLRSLDPGARLGVLVSPRAPEGPLERARRVAAEAINPHFLLVDEQLVGQAHAAGLAVHVYTVDDESQIRRLVQMGVDGIFTNQPGRMRALLNSTARD